MFFLGEFAKIGLTIALLVGVERSIESVRWLPLLIGLIAALQAPLFALLVQHDAPGSSQTEGAPEDGAPDDVVAGRRRR